MSVTVRVTVTLGLAGWWALGLCQTTASPTVSPDTFGLGKVHNITEGHRNSSDHNLFHGVIKANVSAVKTQAVLLNETCYPSLPTHVTPHAARISSFSVLDLIPHGEGGYSEVLSGGVGHPQVCVRLTSQPHKAYYFMIDVWGTYTNSPSSLTNSSKLQ